VEERGMDKVGIGGGKSVTGVESGEGGRRE
jgi:hypothetical protein